MNEWGEGRFKLGLYLGSLRCMHVLMEYQPFQQLHVRGFFAAF